MLAMCGRDLPTASAISCCVRPKRSISAWKPCASSIGFRSMRCTFSTIAISSTSTSLSSRIDGRDRVQAGASARRASGVRRRRSRICRRRSGARGSAAARRACGSTMRDRSARLRRNACAAGADCVAPDRSASARGPSAAACVGAATGACGAGGGCGAFVTGSSNTLRGGSIGARGGSGCGCGWPHVRRASALRSSPARRAERRVPGPVLAVSHRSLSPSSLTRPEFGMLNNLMGNPCPPVKISGRLLTLR